MTSKMVPLKYLVDLNPEKLPESSDPGLKFKYIDISMTGRGKLLQDPLPVSFGSAPSRARRVLRPGDTILSTVRTYLRASWTHRDDDQDLVASTGFVCLRPKGQTDSRFLGWLAQSDHVVEVVVARSVGVSYPAISGIDVGRIKVPNPSRSRQQEIANYLDSEVGRIDELVVAKRKLIVLIKERVWASFSERLFSTGPRNVQIRRTLGALTDGPFGSAFSSRDYEASGAAVVRLGNIGFSHWKGDSLARISLENFRRFKKYEVLEGDLLIAALGDEANHAGRACVAPDLGPAMVKGKCFRARAIDSMASADFMSLVLSSPVGAEAMNISGRGSTRSMINMDILKRTEIPLPSREQQDEIARSTRVEQHEAQAVVSLLESQVAALNERRQALITEAVSERSGGPV